MKKLNVIYVGWGERFSFGTLADDGKDLLFQYSAQALERKLELSPYKLSLQTAAYCDFPHHQHRLPGLISDCLPDGWGMLLMDRLFRKEGRALTDVSPLDRLAFIGDRALGALVFEPAEDERLSSKDLDLLNLARSSRDVLSGESETLLRELAVWGGSPHGARPKVLVSFDRTCNRMSTEDAADGVQMLIKFPAQNEHKEVCAIELVYNRIANACGIKVPAAEMFNLDSELAAFGVERFDRDSGMRVPMHTAAGAAHVDFRMPQIDYVALLRLTQVMTRDIREVVQAYERCVFNVVFNNRDDHSKNFSFLLGRQGRWQFSPAYDLTFCEGPQGEHQMDVCGEAREPARRHLLQLAKKTGIPERKATETIDKIAAVADSFADLANDLPIRKQTLSAIHAIVRKNRDRLAGSEG